MKIKCLLFKKIVPILVLALICTLTIILILYNIGFAINMREIALKQMETTNNLILEKVVLREGDIIFFRASEDMEILIPEEVKLNIVRK